MRTLARETAFKIIFSGLYNMNNLQEAKEEIISEDKITEKNIEFINSILDAYTENFEMIGQKITELTQGYSLSRIYKTDLALLYLAITEILFIKTPMPVVINEVVNLAKRYGEERSSSFVNGVLAKLKV